MISIRNFEEAREVLSHFVPHLSAKSSYTLERMRSLMEFLGSPQDKVKVIHVAGTSGKTSTCYYAASLLKSAGLKVGLTVSPHVTEVNERTQINLEPMPEQEFCRELSEFLKLIDRSDIKPTYFELLIAFAYWVFAKQQVEYAVVEVGLGGLLDGTNVISNPDKVCVITDIGLDHINVLGDTLPEIAKQKAGIIQDNNVVFAYEQSPEVNSVFFDVSKNHHAAFHTIKPKSLSDDFSFLPLFQQRNFELARAAVSYVLQRDGLHPLTNNKLLGAAHVNIPARMEIFRYKGKIIILDGAHNYQKLHALGESIKVRFPDRDIAVLASFVDGRGFRLEGSLEELARITDTLLVTAFLGSQDLPYGPVKTEKLAKIAHNYGFATIEIVNEPRIAFKHLLNRPEPVLLVTGSFFIMNELRPMAQAL